MYPILKSRYALLKQYGSSVIYPIFPETKDAVMSGTYTYERINKTAAEILELCNGARSVHDIAEILASQNETTLDKSLPLVERFIEESGKKGYIDMSKDKTDSHINVSGAFDVVYPFNAQIEITKKCPLKCKHCFNDSGTIKTQEMTTEQVFTVIDKLVAMGVKKVMITGGEPSSRSDFVEIASYAASKFLAISIATNGYCITQSIVDQLAKHRNIAVQISLDGTETSHNYIRGVQDSFTKAVNAIKRFSSAGIPVIVASTFNAYNCNDIEAVTRIAKESGARQITYSATNPTGRAKEDSGLFDYSMEHLLAQMKSLKDKYTDRTFYVHVNDSPKDAECAHHTCGRGCTQICIRENGDVAPCIQFGMAYGNLVAQDPDELFNYKRIYPFLNFAEPDLETCQDCKHAMGCGGCAAIGWDKAVSECAWKQKHMDLINKIKQLQYTGNEEIQ